MGVFDDILQPQAAAPPAVGGGLFDDIVKARAPAGPPAPPISGDNLDPSLRPPTAPLSTGNIDTRGLPEDPGVAKEKQRNARVQAIAQSLRTPNEFPTGVADFVTDSALLGAQRPPMAMLNALLMKAQGKHPDASFGELYQGSDRYMNDRMGRAEQKTGPLAPMVGAISSLPASMALSGVGKAPSAVVGRSPVATTGKVMLDAAKPGFVEGASKNAETLDDAVKGGLTNAAISAGTAGVLDKGQQYALPASRRAAASEASAAKGLDPAQMRDAADTFYKDMDRAGVAYDVRQTIPLNRALRDMQQSLRYSPNAHQPLADYFDQALAVSRRPASYRQLQDLRSAFAGETSNTNPNVRRAAGEVVGHIDDLIRTPPAVNPRGLDMAQTHENATSLWRGANLAADLDFRAGKAGRMVEAGKDINPDAKLRDDLFNYRESITKDRKYNPLGPEGSHGNELLDRAIAGEGANTKRWAGEKLVQGGKTLGGLAGAAGTYAGITHGNSPGYTATLAAMGLPIWGGAHYGGKALLKSAHGDRLSAVDDLLRHVTGTNKLPPGSTISREDLASILATQDLERIAPRVFSAGIGNEPDEKKKTEPKRVYIRKDDKK